MNSKKAFATSHLASELFGAVAVTDGPTIIICLLGKPVKPQPREICGAKERGRVAGGGWRVALHHECHMAR